MNYHPDSTERVFDGLRHLAANIQRVPAFVIPGVEGRTDHAPVAVQAGTWGSILPAVRSFMLAARARGLGTAWTTAQGPRERELAEVLGVPYDDIMLAAFIPLAYTIGTDFKPARRYLASTSCTGTGGSSALSGIHGRAPAPDVRRRAQPPLTRARGDRRW